MRNVNQPNRCRPVSRAESTDERTRRLAGKVYLVGGAVRDELLGLPVAERDWVVVGGSSGSMLAAGFRQADPDFPVFLHPETGEEYALARRERKTGAGYRGFVIDASPQVTLQEDLRRRDLTINAMARDHDGKLIDPFDGQADLAARRLRHISDAFAEDPLRILRVARFAAKLGDQAFRLAHGTHRLMQQMVADGAVSELLPQRVGREMNKALSCAQPWRFFEVLQACGALSALAPGLAGGLSAGHGRDTVETAVRALRTACCASPDPGVRFAALFLQSGDAPQLLQARLAPGVEHIALLEAAREGLEALASGLDATAAFSLLQRLRAWHRGGRFEQVLAVLRAQPGRRQRVEDLQAMREAGIAIDSEALVAQGYQGAELGRALAQARIRAIAAAVPAGKGG